MSSNPFRLTFLAAGQPCVVLIASPDLREVVEILDRADRAAAYAGRMPSPAAQDFIETTRRLLAIAELVPQPEPRMSQQGAQPARWMTTAEAARALGITERAVRKRIATGALTARQLGGRWLIDSKEIPNAAA